jgi:nucleoside-diphosphate-sugar epimerase
MNKRVLVTGASGFVGRRLCAVLANRGWRVRAAVRDPRTPLPAGVDRVVTGELGPDTDWREALAGVEGIVHLAARVHVMRETAGDPLAEFRRVNVDGTLNLARQAARDGARRFVFVSSIKVNGEETRPGQPFTEDDLPGPLDSYAVSKHEAEQGLWRIAGQTGLGVVVIRPPLLYGPGVKGNFPRLMRLIRSGLPLPLGTVKNRRSLLGLDNLLDFLMLCLAHPAAANQTFLVADGEDLSTPGLVRRLALAMNRPARLLPVPVSWLRLAGRMLDRTEEVARLTGTLQLDIAKARTLLGWEPPLSVDEGLRRTVAEMDSQD